MSTESLYLVVGPAGARLAKRVPRLSPYEIAYPLHIVRPASWGRIALERHAMTDIAHTMVTQQERDDGWVIECPTCGKVVILSKDPLTPPETVIRGDVEASHAWLSGTALVIATGWTL